MARETFIVDKRRRAEDQGPAEGRPRRRHSRSARRSPASSPRSPSSVGAQGRQGRQAADDGSDEDADHRVRAVRRRGGRAARRRSATPWRARTCWCACGRRRRGGRSGLALLGIAQRSIQARRTPDGGWTQRRKAFPLEVRSAGDMLLRCRLERRLKQRDLAAYAAGSP